ncbi:MAG: efflux RND transporter periplasmic adaptor subunit [Leptospirillia bacterium]
MTNTFKKLIGFTLLVLVLVLAGLTLGRKPEDVPLYAAGEVSRGDQITTVSATGTVNPLTTVQVGSQVSGTIERLFADFNSHVTQGQVIAQIEPSLFKAQVAQAEANRKAAEAASDKARVLLLEAKRELDRTEKLHAQELIPDSTFDTVKFAHDAATVEFEAREAAVAQTAAALTLAKVNLAHTTIYAPIDGMVVSRDVNVGQTVAASLQAPVLFTIVPDLIRMQIETEVDEAFIGAIEAGQEVNFNVFAYPHREFHGTLAQVRLNPTVEAGVVKYNCIVHVDNPDLALKPGMTATVSIVTARASDVLTVPNAALRFVPPWPPERLAKVKEEMARGQGLLWLPEGAGFRPLTVTPGLVGEVRTEVSAEGLEEGQTVALPPERSRVSNRRRGFRLF